MSPVEFKAVAIAHRAGNVAFRHWIAPSVKEGSLQRGNYRVRLLS
jgi:hypothetical protein